MREWVKAIIYILICEAAGFIGSAFTYSSISTWYAGLIKPPFNPPGWLFAPAWIILYALMGLSLYFALSKNTKSRKPFIAFDIQLALNVIWSFLFFGLQSSFYSLVEIIILWFAILATIISFYKISKNAALLLIPYILWVSFAMILNYYILILNL